MEYELKLTLNDGRIFSTGGFKTLASCIEFCKENAQYYKDVEIIYYAYTGAEIVMRLEDAIVEQDFRNSKRRFQL